LKRHGDWGFFESKLFSLPLDRLVALPEDKQVFFVRPAFASGALTKMLS